MRLVPSVEQMKSHVGFAELVRVLDVHMQAIGAAVDLRHPYFHKNNQLGVQSTALNVMLDAKQGRKTGRSDRRSIQSLHHRYSPQCFVTKATRRASLPRIEFR